MRLLIGCRLVIYTPGATVVRMLTTNALIAYISTWVLWISGASDDPRMLLPAWISISTVCALSSLSSPRKVITLTKADFDSLILFHAEED